MVAAFLVIAALLLLLLLVLALVASISWAVLLTRLTTGFIRATKLPEIAPTTGTGRVTAIVPMRNEISNIGHCIYPLLTDPEIAKIIAVDDHSDDGTQYAVKRFTQNEKVELLEAPELQKEWTGKSNACYAGALASNSSWLLFTDADTFVSPGVVSRALRVAKEGSLDAITCFGGLRCRGLWDKIAVPLYFALLNSFIKFGGNQEGKGSYFMGSFILIKRSEYFRIGGHAAVSGELVEDKALSDVAVKAGLKIKMIYAPKLVSAEWAPGFKNGIRALSRVTMPPMRRNPLSAFAFAFALTLLFILPLFSLIISFQPSIPLGSEFLLFGILSVSFEIVISAYAVFVMQPGKKRHHLYSLLFVLPKIVFLFVLWSNVFKLYGRPQIAWRGRHYELSRR